MAFRDVEEGDVILLTKKDKKSSDGGAGRIVEEEHTISTFGHTAEVKESGESDKETTTKVYHYCMTMHNILC